MKNGEIIWIRKNEINVVGLQLRILADKFGTLKGINISETNKNKVIKQIFISDESEIEKLTTELEDILASR